MIAKARFPPAPIAGRDDPVRPQGVAKSLVIQQRFTYELLSEVPTTAVSGQRRLYQSGAPAAAVWCARLSCHAGRATPRLRRGQPHPGAENVRRRPQFPAHCPPASRASANSHTLGQRSRERSACPRNHPFHGRSRRWRWMRYTPSSRPKKEIYVGTLMNLPGNTFCANALLVAIHLLDSCST